MQTGTQMKQEDLGTMFRKKSLDLFTQKELNGSKKTTSRQKYSENYFPEEIKIGLKKSHLFDH